MNVKSLKVFCDVVGRRSFSQAAAENGISQPGASQIVQQLEDTLELKLIDRSKRPFILTPEGEVFHDGCRIIVQKYYALVEEVRSLHRDVEGRVNIASIYSVGLSYGKQLVDVFTDRHPKAAVHIEFQSPGRVCELVAEGQVDFGLVSFAQSSKTITAVEWCEEPMAMICSPKHMLAKRESVAGHDIDGMDIIGFDRELRVRREVDRYLARQGIEVQVDIAFDNIDTIKHAIEINAGASFLPRPAVHDELLAGTLVAVPVDGFEMIRPLGIIHRRGVELGKSARRFIELLHEYRTLAADMSGPDNARSADGDGPARIDRASDKGSAKAVSAGQ
jgi:DNA-binding transcriptional LysR family regulator